MSVQSLLLLVCIATPLTEGVADRRFLLPLRLPHQEEAVESTSHSEKVVIEPFLQIQLQFVDIGVSSEVSSAQMMSFCSTWHFVRRIHLFSTATTTGNPSIDLSHITTIARTCPGLDYVRLRFDASRTKDDTVIPEFSRTGPLRSIYVGDSPAYPPTAVLRCFRSQTAVYRSHSE